MQDFGHLKDLTHHAYLFIGAKVHEIVEFLEHHHKIPSKNNPDFYHQKYDSFGIDESRKLKDIHSSKSFTEGAKRIFIIETPSMTHEAQNALLKIFEEPHEDTHFFIVMPSAELLLPTLRSRLFIVPSSHQKKDMAHIETFLKLSQKEKIAFVDELAEKISDEKATKADAQVFLSELETVLHQKTDFTQASPDDLKKFTAVLKARDYMNDRSSSVKQLLEYVALSL